MLEIEVKLPTQNLQMLIDRLLLAGYIRGTTVYEHDTYFNGKVMDLKAEDKALRIREHKDLDSGEIRYVLNFKGPKIDDSTMTREETQFEVPSFESGLKVINGLGFFEAGTVEKTRCHYKKDEITCCADQITGLGDFLEIEIMADEGGYDAAILQIKELLGYLGYGMEDTVRHSYLSMLMKGEKESCRKN